MSATICNESSCAFSICGWNSDTQTPVCMAVPAYAKGNTAPWPVVPDCQTCKSSIDKAVPGCFCAGGVTMGGNTAGLNPDYIDPVPGQDPSTIWEKYSKTQTRLPPCNKACTCATDADCGVPGKGGSSCMNGLCACTSDSDCPPGGQCSPGGACRGMTCSADWQCARAYGDVCDQGKCAPMVEEKKWLWYGVAIGGVSLVLLIMVIMYYRSSSQQAQERAGIAALLGQ